MNKENHIKELEMAIEHIKKEPVKGWIARMGKSYRIRKIEKKIQSLKKELGHD
jgi:hypothetical protein